MRYGYWFTPGLWTPPPPDYGPWFTDSLWLP